VRDPRGAIPLNPDALKKGMKDTEAYIDAEKSKRTLFHYLGYIPVIGYGVRNIGDSVLKILEASQPPDPGTIMLEPGKAPRGKVKLK